VPQAGPMKLRQNWSYQARQHTRTTQRTHIPRSELDDAPLRSAECQRALPAFHGDHPVVNDDGVRSKSPGRHSRGALRIPPATPPVGTVISMTATLAAITGRSGAAVVLLETLS
jgi:hypothetical protein